MKCPYCQGDNPDGAQFCGDCGRSLQPEPVCPQCGHTNPEGKKFCNSCGHALAETAPAPPTPPSPEPTSFVDGRYQVKKVLGEGGKKKVYLAHDGKLDRDVAFYLLKTEKLDEEARTRITREAKAMGRLGSHQHIVTIFDQGEQDGQPYMVAELMAGDVDGLIEKAPEHRLPIEQAIDIAKSVCLGLELAHSEGIVHRDLKPGNVLLSADGTAKIGDFGLAVAIDLSRLTQEGMMVGTVSYMPPEQAMGGEVTPKADLYSLGAMLYEMVTGRPPFPGDDPVAIIGQHINTPPVSPTWHRADIPLSLEALIVQLLEKNPQKRPASAADVLQVLESIEAGKAAEAVSEEAPAIDRGPLYRRVFVGRESELKQLQSAFDGAMSGNGALMMVVGEPGIGKTAICEQISTYATLRGGKHLVGHCYEEGSLSLPYLAFVEAMRSYVLARETKDLRKELGTGAVDVARIVSEIRERLKVKPQPPGDPQEERYRLLQSVTSFLTNAARVQPLVVVLEDLHDADKGTLDMLTHIARNLTGARLLIIGTYRDVEVDRAHPLSATLADLRRVATFGRVLLRGLNADEVQRMLASITGEDTPWGLAEEVHRRTEGNPLFVQEVVRYLVEEGLISREEGRWRPMGETPVEMRIPEGLRDVIGKRLSLMSPECNRLLSIAAVIGREFRLDVLQRVADTSEDELFTALEEAKAAAVLEERSSVGVGAAFHFTHAFFRQTLYEEMFTPRRIRTHQQVGRALEEVYARRREEHAAELATHFAQSTEHDDLVKALGYSEMAAQRALAVYAYGENVRLLEQALKVQEVLDPEDKAKQCDLLRALGNALSIAGEPRRALDVAFPAAFSLAEEIGDSRRAFQVCRLTRSAIQSWRNTLRTPEAAEWAARADRYAEPDTVDRAWADAFLGLVKIQTDNPEEGVPLLARSLELARRLGDTRTFLQVANTWLVYVQAPQHDEERLHLAEELEEIIEQLRTGLSTRVYLETLDYMGRTFFTWGQRQRVEKFWGEFRELAERSRIPVFIVESMWHSVFLATLDGHLEEAIEIVARTLARGEELGIPEFARTVAGSELRAQLYLGQADAILQRLQEGTPLEALCLAHLGRDDEAAEILEQRVLAPPGIGSAEDETPAYTHISLLEAAVLVRHREAAELLLRRLAGNFAPVSGLGGVMTARHLGAAAALLGRPEEARKHYQKALKVANEMRFRPEVALTRLQLAELLLEHYPKEKPEALEHLDFAIGEFRDMKMQPSLERALKHKEILGA